MDKTWPPAAPDVQAQFRAAHEAQQSEPAKLTPDETITKEHLESLEQGLKATAPQMHLTPQGIKPRSANIAQVERIEKLKQRFQQSSAKGREDFNRAAEREI